MVNGWNRPRPPDFKTFTIQNSTFDIRQIPESLQPASLFPCHPSRGMLKKSVQQGRRRIETGGVPPGYVEDFDELRTKLADFFSIPLVDYASPTEQLRPVESSPGHQGSGQDVEIAVHVGSG